MKSTEKLWIHLEQMQQADDAELAGNPLGLPAPMLRGAIAMAGDFLPREPEELDEFLTRVGDFCHDLRSDGYAPGPEH